MPVFTSQPAISESLSLPTNVYTSRRHRAGTCFTTQEALTTGMFTTGMKASASSFSYASRPRREQTESNNEYMTVPVTLGTCIVLIAFCSLPASHARTPHPLGIFVLKPSSTPLQSRAVSTSDWLTWPIDADTTWNCALWIDAFSSAIS